jgi:mono/diheme cytochrome c family protein
MAFISFFLVGVQAQESGQNQQTAEKSSAGDPAAGQIVFEDSCSMCHDPKSTEMMIGPGLKDVSKRKSEAEIREQIASGSDMMPPFANKLSEEEINNLVAYLKTL